MEGLEVSVLLKSELEFSKRLDAEYYRKELLNYEKKIKEKKNCIELSENATFIIGPFGSSFNTENYIDYGEYRYVRGQDVKPFVLKNEDIRYLPKEDFYRLEKYSLRENDILISVVGTLGNACIVNKENLPAIFSCKSTVIRTSKLNPNYLLAFLNSKYGRELLLRKERGAIQKGLNLEDLKTILIPVLNITFQNEIEKIIKQSHNNLEQSKTLYTQAEQILLQELGFNNFSKVLELSGSCSSIKTFKESYQTSSRLDAEYYQPKYDEILKAINNYKNGTVKLSNYFEHIKVEIKKEKEGYNYIEIGDVNISNGEVNSNYLLTENLPANAKVKVRKNDLLVSKVRPYRGAVAIIDFEIENLVASGAFTVLRTKDSLFHIEALCVLLKSFPYKELMMKFNVGSSYPVIRDEDVLNLPIPKLSIETQTQISTLIQQSFQLRQQSKHLLEVAKQAVETAIEQNETVAMGLISKIVLTGLK